MFILENTLIAKLKSLGIYRADKNHVNEPQAEEDIEGNYQVII